LKRDILKKQDDRDLRSIGEAGKRYTRNVVTSTFFVKTGMSINGSIDMRPFADHKAKKMNLSGFSFPVYIIRKQKQRSSNSDLEGGLKPPF
jgi:hypothetical protein